MPGAVTIQARAEGPGIRDCGVVSLQTMTAQNPTLSDPDLADHALDADRLEQGGPAVDDLRSAADVLRAEAAGITAMAAAMQPGQPLGAAFVRTVEMLSALPGRVVVCGMGKSGHVGRKIQATLASTGTPSLFVHPAEASHGDLGMIQAGDAVLALSNSGETAELADVIAHSRRFDMTLVAITGAAASTLARAADIVLVLPAAAEACPMGLAPTTSTTMQLALGDALAVALLQRRGFTAREFGLYHPGGRLGARLRRVGELMHTGEAMPLAEPDLPMLQAVMLMTSKAFGCLGITGPDGRLAGIITDGDLRRAIDRDLRTLRTADVMNTRPRTIPASMLAAEALRLMNEALRPITSLFVLDEAGRPAGILHVHDLLRAGIA
ncbi:KpsF/GutQ family sugar-phosphate isomerase [Lichenicoccus roseus]|nr:KpsF/GutQ family sugar-phosphate isomerase [Lichenicoccus roseus]